MNRYCMSIDWSCENDDIARETAIKISDSIQQMVMNDKNMVNVVLDIETQPFSLLNKDI